MWCYKKNINMFAQINMMDHFKTQNNVVSELVREKNMRFNLTFLSETV